MKSNLQAKRNYTTIISLVLILFVAGFLRIFELKTLPPGLYPDEAMNGNNALEAIQADPPNGGYKIFYPENNGREGLFINIQAFFLKLFIGQNDSPEPWMLRFPSALFGILTVLGVYLLTREMFGAKISFYTKPAQANGHGVRSEAEDERAEEQASSPRWGERSGLSKNEILALLSTFLLAVSFWHINFSRIGFRAIMAPTFLVWGIWLLLMSFRKWGEYQITRQKNPKHEARNSKQTQNSNYPNSKRFLISNFKNWDLFQISDFGFRISIPAILAGMVYGLGMYSYIAYRATPLLIVFILWLFTFKYGWRTVLKIGALFIIGATIASLPLIIYFAENPQDFFGRTTQVSVLSSENALLELGLNITKTIGMFFVTGDYNWRHNIAGEPQLFWPVAVFFGIGIIVGIKEIFTRNSKFKILNFNSISNEENFKLSTEGESPLDACLPVRQGYIDTYGGKVKNSENNLMFSALVLLVWLIIATLPVIISNEGIPHALRAILMIPPTFILSAIGAYKLYNLFKKYLPPKLLFAVSCLLFAVLITQSFHSYFIKWGENKETAGAFSKNYVEIGKELNSLPIEMPKYVIVEAGGVNVRGLPMSTQTTMFITNTFTPEKQKEKNIFYILPNEKEKIPGGAYILEIK